MIKHRKMCWNARRQTAERGRSPQSLPVLFFSLIFSLLFLTFFRFRFYFGSSGLFTVLSTAYHLMNKCLSSFSAARLLLARRKKPHNLHGFMATILFFNTIRNPSCTRHFFLRISDFLFCFVLFFGGTNDCHGFTLVFPLGIDLYDQLHSKFLH